jgi:hypothetical protein
MTPSFASTKTEQSPRPIGTQEAQTAEPNFPTHRVSHLPQEGLSPLQRARAIQMADKLIARYDHEYERTGCFSAKGNADRVRLMRAQLQEKA